MPSLYTRAGRCQDAVMTGVTGKLFLPVALLPTGWATDVLIGFANGRIDAVEAGVVPPEGAVPLPGIGLPGIGNLHSHSFQRGMAGLAERGGPRDDHFWTWREVMYRFLAVLDPDEVEALAALAFMEMLESGFTGVAEFHYLHNAPDGSSYAAPAELAARIAAAAQATGIGLTLLPVFYAHGGFGGAPPTSGQRRFVLSLDDFARLHEECRNVVASLPEARVGIAPHSLRAVSPQELSALVGMAGEAPIHMHIAEQTAEVADCVAATGARPVQWLLDHAPVDGRWCLIHATHMAPDETHALAATGAVAGLCPVTEANLGDGIFPAKAYVEAGGRFGVGTDSNICISLPQELRALEYAQRLGDRARNRLAEPGQSTGRRLFDMAAAGGAQALGRRIGALEVGARADVVVLDPDHPALAGRTADAVLDSWIFAGGYGCVRDVFVGGAHVVADGKHHARAAIVARWRERAAGLSGSTGKTS